MISTGVVQQPLSGCICGDYMFRLTVTWVSPKAPTYVKVQETKAEGPLCSPRLRDRASPFPTTAMSSELGSAFLALHWQAGSHRVGLEALCLGKASPLH